jgi:hypothetical protein
MNESESLSFHMYRSVAEKAGGGAPPEGTCAWCNRAFDWDADGECVFYDVLHIESSAGNRPSFRLGTECGERLAALFRIDD